MCSRFAKKIIQGEINIFFEKPTSSLA